VLAHTKCFLLELLYFAVVMAQNIFFLFRTYTFIVIIIMFHQNVIA